MTHAEIERLYPAAVVRINDRRPPAMASADLEHAMAWAALIGERDPEMLVGFTGNEGTEQLRNLALKAMVRAPGAVIANLSDAEAVTAAVAVLGSLAFSDALLRALGPVQPALQGRYGRLEHRAIHARKVLHLIAADSDVQRAAQGKSS